MKVTNLFDMQSKFTELHVTILDLTNLKQKFEQVRIFKLNKYKFKLA